MPTKFDPMPNYRRSYVPGGTFFLTLVTYCRRPFFKNPDNIDLLRIAVAKIKAEKPFEIVAAAILPDHLHFIKKKQKINIEGFCFATQAQRK